MARRKSDPQQQPSASAMSFEDALAGLEAIVEAMEHQNLPLEDLVAGYEQGSVLLERCESVLDSARRRIELITLRDKRAAGTGDSFQPPATADLPTSSADADSPDDDDDIRLF